MALDYLTLQHKPNIKLSDKNGVKHICKDLLVSTNMGNLSGGFQKCVVNKYYVGRPDLISFAFYGTDEYADTICKVNGISNPFELNENDLLNIPRVEEVRFYAKANRTPSELVEDNPNIGKSKVSKQKAYNMRRSPAQQVVGDNNYIIDRSSGLVFY